MFNCISFRAVMSMYHTIIHCTIFRILIGYEPTGNYAYFGADKINLVCVKVKF